jgi:hypothetical protein
LPLLASVFKPLKLKIALWASRAVRVVLNVRIENGYFFFEYHYLSKLENPWILSSAVLGRMVTLKHSIARGEMNYSQVKSSIL